VSEHDLWIILKSTMMFLVLLPMNRQLFKGTGLKKMKARYVDNENVHRIGMYVERLFKFWISSQNLINCQI